MKDILKKHSVKILRKELQNIKKNIKIDLIELKAINKISKNKVIELLIKYKYDISKLPKLIKKEPIKKNILKIQERYNNYEKVIKYLDILNIEDGCISLTDKKNTYKLTENLLLDKQIGSESVYGVVYLTKNINSKYKNIRDMALKIQTVSNSTKKEKIIFEDISNIGIKNKYIHFPIFYKTFTCSKKILKKDISEYPQPIKTSNLKKNGKYEIILSELADGDLSSFFKNNEIIKNIELVKNIINQCIIALLCIHSIGYIHNDAHFGNFLYYKIEKGGYFHYKINDKDCYIENLGYLVTTSDYGLTYKIKNKNKEDYFIDYDKLLASMFYYEQFINIREILLMISQYEYSFTSYNEKDEKNLIIKIIDRFFNEKKENNIISSMIIKI